MERIGASDTWQYHGYFNSQVSIDGRQIESVSGGTRWGGGLWINTRDAARFAYLFLRRGKWNGKQIISEHWIKAATTPASTGPDYGYLWWLNTQRKQPPSAPATSFTALGYGSNTIWIDPEHDLVVVWRWHQGSADELVKRILAASQNQLLPATHQRSTTLCLRHYQEPHPVRKSLRLGSVDSVVHWVSNNLK